MEKLPVIILARPMDEDDPGLICSGDNYLFQDLLSQFRKEVSVENIIFSCPKSIPEKIKQILSQWTIEIHYSDYDLPQKRVAEIFDRKGYEKAVLFSSYTYLIDKQAFIEVSDLLINDKVDFVYTKDVIPAKYFIGVNKKVVDKICTNYSFPVTSLAFHSYIKTEKDISISSIDNIETVGEKFLWELFFTGEKAKLPSDILTGFFNRFSIDRWFSRFAFKELLNDTL